MEKDTKLSELKKRVTDVVAEVRPQAHKLPTLEELYSNAPAILKQNQLNMILNSEPKPEWCKVHPIATTKNELGKIVPCRYVPVGIQEFIATALFGKWREEIKEIKLVANSVVAIVRIYVLDPLTGEWDWQDGTGATPIQTDAGASPTDFSKIKSSAIQMAAPSAASYARSDAFEKFGKIFGKDLNRYSNAVDYRDMLEKKILNK